jgi:glutamine synthetase
MLEDIVDQIEKGGAKSAKSGGELKIGASVLPTLPRDPGDRNRTSPFAFTGNKFEFRAAGSAQSIAGPIVVLNTIVAESVDYIATHLEQAVAAGKDLNSEIQKLLQAVIKESRWVVFNGDNYSEAWHAEAERRGFPNRKSTVDSLPDLISPKSVELFTKYKVFNERELHSRYEIFLEGYRKALGIESQLTLQIATRMILPAALRYQAEVAGAVANLKAAGLSVPKHQTALLDELVHAIDALQSASDKLSDVIDEHPKGDTLDHAKHSRDVVIPAMNAVRAAGDTLETLVASDLWPLPTYQEMLFIK